jgi:hypothetical protein
VTAALSGQIHSPLNPDPIDDTGRSRSSSRVTITAGRAAFARSRIPLSSGSFGTASSVFLGVTISANASIACLTTRNCSRLKPNLSRSTRSVSVRMARETIISIYLSIHGHLNPLPGFAPEPDRKGPFSIQSTTSIESVSNGKRKDPLISKSLTTTKPIKRLPPVLPGKILLEDLKDEGVSMNALVFNERRSITADTSLRLARFFGTSLHYRLNLQNRF